MATATEDKTKEQTGSVTVPTVDIDATLSSTREQFVAQMEELRPAHDAFVKLEGIVQNFDRLASGTPGRKRGTSGTIDRAGRGQRSQELLAVIRESGDEGVAISEAVDKIPGVNQNYLYRLAKELLDTDEPQVRKEGKRYYAL